ncbi:HD domain-containing protein [Marinobacterium mangrovicola]|uniref:Putative metal-dependent HD superfamily phosphohydrolase n=1 Tax=Marinobacterium mangrovicola TaxID=1476959 RepID=A0A4R1GA71_9GAMM|nr:hypothetical protein [Marinobacterium mangrovicola]TCK04874.1 putative metal-dependent HD superfamily phosphohydrolase [Marinobacterium mangrovicola]
MNAERFKQLWTRNVTASGSSGDAQWVCAYLEKQYRHPGRHYHDCSHIEECLKWLDLYADTVADPDAVELAIWFHDVCYLPTPVGHEERSAQLFIRMVGNGMAAERRDKIARMIGYTTHTTPPQGAEEALMVDIDMASFARPWHQYLIDTVHCRLERHWLNDLEFCEGQIGFLEKMLARPSFYYSEAFKQRHEQDARTNMQRMIELLQKRRVRLSHRVAVGQG